MNISELWSGGGVGGGARLVMTSIKCWGGTDSPLTTRN